MYNRIEAEVRAEMKTSLAYKVDICLSSTSVVMNASVSVPLEWVQTHTASMCAV